MEVALSGSSNAIDRVNDGATRVVHKNKISWRKRIFFPSSIESVLQTLEMNDSFLEDLDLVPRDAENSKHPERNVTTRRAALKTSSAEEKEKGDLETMMLQAKVTSDTQKNLKVEGNSKQRPTGISKTTNFQNVEKKCAVKAKEAKLGLAKVESEVKVTSKLQEIKPKSAENKSNIKQQQRRSCGNVSNCSDNSTKENNRPIDAQLEPVKDKRRSTGSVAKKPEGSGKEKVLEPVALLNAIKDLVSNYTKQESTKILRVMHELHVNSQANLIKNLLLQEDLSKEGGNTGRESARLKFLLEENERLREEISVLQMRNEELQRTVEEYQSKGEIGGSKLHSKDTRS